ATLIFFPFLSVGSAKVEIFSQLPNKIWFYFFSWYFLFCLSICRPFNQLPFLPKRDAKIAKITTTANGKADKMKAKS
ncbi:hypothetical protein, partial [Pedobacter sp. N23S346]|uniref:hypothetical protein n=1 Tax=Pedobacter sp. N23S346 TaxID=3402750 RepID=UPI003AC6C67B